MSAPLPIPARSADPPDQATPKSPPASSSFKAAQMVRTVTTTESLEATVASAKRSAGFAAVQDHVVLPSASGAPAADGERRPLVVGIGSGSTVIPVVEALKQMMSDAPGGFKKNRLDVVCVPTSWQAKDLIVEAGFQLGDLSQYPSIDVDIDGADECDPELNCIKGGGGCQLQEKMVAYWSKKFIVVADYRKEADRLGTKWTQGVPIEVVPGAYTPILSLLLSPPFSALTASLRMGVRKAGPVVTDNGNLIIDAHFGPIDDPKELEGRIKMVPGVVEVGLFCGMAEEAYFGQADGSVTVRNRNGSVRKIPPAL
ncbi:ribose-5-phosphate isomerase [Hyaloraphidium curvatum]|nr:ribose-5-phosphate isomerase [Hyaloraphidium curvatum]